MIVIVIGRPGGPGVRVDRHCGFDSGIACAAPAASSEGPAVSPTAPPTTDAPAVSPAPTGGSPPVSAAAATASSPPAAVSPVPSLSAPATATSSPEGDPAAPAEAACTAPFAASPPSAGPAPLTAPAAAGPPGGSSPPAPVLRLASTLTWPRGPDTTISVARRSAPVVLSVQVRLAIRPSTSTGAPLRTSFRTASAAAPKATTECHSVDSPTVSSLRLKRSVVARLNCATSSPDCSLRISGLRPA